MDSFKSEALEGSPVQSKIAKIALCTDVTLVHARECAKAMEKGIAYAMPNSNNVTAIPSFKKLFTDEKYVDGARRAAQKILRRFESEKTKNANLFEDIKTSYIEAGMTEEDAKDATWEVLAVVSSGGANTNIKLDSFNSSSPAFDQLKTALTAISWAIPKLDLISTPEGHTYSLPANVQTTCEIGKPYHFWMTAYISRKLVREGSSPDAAAAAAFLLQKGYEMRSTTAARDPNRAFTIDSYAPWNNMMRIDTGFASAASVFGANEAKGINKTIDIDQGIKRIILEGKIKPKITEIEAAKLWTMERSEFYGIKGYLRWQSIIAADAGFAYHKKFLGK